MENPIPKIEKIIRTVPLRILRPKYSDSLEKALKIFKEKNSSSDTSKFWKAFRDKDIEFFEELGLTEDELKDIENNVLYKLGLDLNRLYDYLSFLQIELMQQYNLTISSIVSKRMEGKDFSDLNQNELNEHIKGKFRDIYGSYFGNGLNSIVSSNLGGKFPRKINSAEITKIGAISKGLMSLPVAKSKEFPITIEKTGSNFIEFLTSNNKELSEIDEYESGMDYGDLIVNVTLPWFKINDKKFDLITAEEAHTLYETHRKNELLDVPVILTTWSIRRKKEWRLDGSSQSIVRKIANKELEKEWNIFVDSFVSKYGEEGEKKLLRAYGIKKRSKQKETKGEELSIEEQFKKLKDSLESKAYPSKIDIIPDRDKWKIHFAIDIPPSIKEIDENLWGGVDFGVKNIMTLCIKKNGEKEDYEFLTIWGNDLLKHAQTWFARNRIMRKQDEEKATGHGVSRKTRAQEKYAKRMQRLKQKITERLIKQASDFFLGRNKFHKAVGKLHYENLNTLWRGETKQAVRLRSFINKQQLFAGIERKLKEYNPSIYIKDRYPHYTSRLCSKCGKLNLYFDFIKYRTKKKRTIVKPDGSRWELWPFFICEFCGWKMDADKNAAVNNADIDYQIKLNEEKKFCGIKRKEEEKEEQEGVEEATSKRVNKTSVIYQMIKDSNDNKEKMYEKWRKSLKKQKFKPHEQKEYKDLFDCLFQYYSEIIQDESKT